MRQSISLEIIVSAQKSKHSPRKKGHKVSVPVLSEGSFDILKHCCTSDVRKASRYTVPVGFLVAPFRMSLSSEKAKPVGE